MEIALLFRLVRQKVNQAAIFKRRQIGTSVWGNQKIIIGRQFQKALWDSSFPCFQLTSSAKMTRVRSLQIVNKPGAAQVGAISKAQK